MIFLKQFKATLADSCSQWDMQTPCLFLWLQGNLSQATIPVTTTNDVNYTDHHCMVAAVLI